MGEIQTPPEAAAEQQPKDIIELEPDTTNIHGEYEVPDKQTKNEFGFDAPGDPAIPPERNEIL